MTSPAVEIASPWLTQKQAVAYSHRSERLINEALRKQELRGHQSGRGGRWLIHREDLDAWIRGEKATVEAPAVSRRRPRAVPS